ncbi:MAG: STAS domain-containing protein [Planctomycetota bacterium]|jgi:anti-anti-sigma factor|nr:STAS domain-containing protein [Planctomycetota bacterium]
MKIDKLLFEHYAELRLRGEFDTFYAPKLGEEIDQLISSGYTHTILNMRLVKFINSTALGSIIKANKRLRAEGGELVLAQPSGFCLDVLTKIGVDKVVPMFSDSDAARDHLLKGMTDDGAPQVIGESNVLFEFDDADRIGTMKGRRTGLGTVLRVDHEGIRFSWDGGGRGLGQEELASLFGVGLTLGTKFKVKLCKKDYFNVQSTIGESEFQEEDGTWSAAVYATFNDLSDRDGLALAQFADDLDYLKQQLKDVR